MAGNKNSGRRPAPPREVWESGQEGVREVTTRTILKEKPQHPVIKKLDRALSDADDLDVSDYIKTVFDCGADGIWVYRIVNGEEYKVGTLKAHMDFGEDGEAFLLNHYGGPGTFVLKAAVKSAYGGLMRASKPKRVRLGLSDQQDAGSYAIPGNDADAIITRTLAREEKMHALNKIKELNTVKESRKEDDMKPEELVSIVRELKGSDKTSEILLEMLKTERERMSQITADARKQNPLELLAPLAVPLFGFLDKKLSPNTVGKWIEMLRNPAAEPAQESFWTGLRSLLSDFAPMLQPIMQKLGEQVAAAQVPGSVPVRPTLARQPVIPTAPNPPLTEDDMASRDYDDEDTKEVLDYVLKCLDESKFAEAWAALRACEDTQDVVAPIVPGPEPMAFWFKLKEVDERMRTRKDVGLEFIGYIQKQIKDYIEAQQATQTQAGETAPAPGAPAA